MNAERAVATGFVCVGVIGLMVFFPPTVTRYEEYWDKNERLLHQPVWRVEHSYEFIGSIPDAASRVTGYEVKIDWVRLVLQVAVVTGGGLIAYRIGGIQNPAERESPPAGGRKV